MCIRDSGITVQIERCDLLHMADAQVVITASLIDAEQKLMRVYGCLLYTSRCV